MRTTETERKQTMETRDVKQVQCADCLKWIDADKNHTCKQQVRRNRKKGS